MTAAGIVLGAGFVARQLRIQNPLVDMRLFAARTFTAAFAAAVIAMFATYGMVFFTAQYFQLVLGLSPLQAGLCGLPPALTMMLTAGVVLPKLATRVRPAFLIAGGLVAAAAGLGLLTQVGPGSGWVEVVGAMMLAVAGMAPAMTLGVNLIVGVAPPERVAAVSGLADAGNELAGALGIAILGTTGTAIYRGQMAGTHPAAAAESLGGAVSVGHELPVGVLDSAVAAFAHGMHVATGAGAAVLLTVAAAAAVLLRHVPHDTGAIDPHREEAAGHPPANR